MALLHEDPKRRLSRFRSRDGWWAASARVFSTWVARYRTEGMVRRWAAA